MHKKVKKTAEKAPISSHYEGRKLRDKEKHDLLLLKSYLLAAIWDCYVQNCFMLL